MRHAFKSFDPKEGTKLPAWSFEMFFAIVYRARKRLAHRSRTEIFAAAELIDKILWHPGLECTDARDMREAYEPMRAVRLSDPPFDGIPAESDAGELLHRAIQIPLSEIQGSAGWQWDELFATLSLSFVDKAIQLESERGSDSQFSDDHLSPSSLLEETDLLMAAMEAACYAEGMFSGERIGKLAKGILDAEQNKLLSARNKRASDVAHADSHRLHEMVYEVWRDGKGLSMAQAARQVLEGCPEQLVAHIKPENRVARLRAGGSKVRKKHQIPRPTGTDDSPR